MRRNGIIGLMLVVAVIFAAIHLFWRWTRWDYRRNKNRTAQIILSLASNVDSIRNKTGRLPTNESELASMLDQEMPQSAWGAKIEYSKTGSNSFRLSTMSPYPMLDIFNYDSTRTPRPLSIYPF